ncbi:hypothetical protein JL107_01720 [Nakamurella flavida]|uniref:RNA polymerase sigma-70 region 2 domain-containing protein n=1 Tax=Nakamurella flavida TaxID=363630 RepID=A0A939C400_9ACTN|nr:sigma factor [Nakamurella flavida]MBM9475154.1 hypothetical protein [Nakamurella flavida]MDP9776723.1 RNA polymerase sigma-70 factor (ECF subfamily) [Nakamurella flavida]
MTLIAAGDRMALAHLYDHTVPVVYGICRGILGSEVDAEKITQDVYIEVWTSAARFRESDISVTQWICRIAYQRAVDGHRAPGGGRQNLGHSAPPISGGRPATRPGRT